MTRAHATKPKSADLQRSAEVKRKHAIQTKLLVGSAHDPLEREADRIATEVVGQGERTSAASPAASAVQTKVEPPKPRPLLDDEKKKDEKVQRHGGDGAFEATPSFESMISGGGGHPLSHSDRSFFEPRLGTDLGGVRVHHDSNAAAAAREIDAQAFTRGRDVYFGAGQYQPHTDSGRWLLAHELAHTMQQSGGVRRKGAKDKSAKPSKQADDEAKAPPALDAAKARLGPKIANTAEAVYIPVLEVPKFKAEHYGPGRTYYHSVKFDRKGENDARQVSEWNKAMGDDSLAIAAFRPECKDDRTYIVTGKIGSKAVISDNLAELAARLRRPFWDEKGTAELPHDVDHKVELQIGGWPDAKNRDFLSSAQTNLELLEHSANASSGSTIAGNVEKAIAAGLKVPQLRDALPKSHRTVDAIKGNYDVVFDSIVGKGGPANPSRWSLEDVRGGKHIKTLKTPASKVGLYDLTDPNPPAPFRKHKFKREDLIGSAHSMVIYVGGMKRVAIKWNPKEQSRTLTAAEVKALGFPKATIEMDMGSVGGSDPAQTKGKLVPDELWRYPRTKINADPAIGTRAEFGLRRLNHTTYAWSMRVPGLANKQGAFKPLSPIQFEELDFDGEELFLAGRIKPSLSFLEKVPVFLLFRGDTVALEATFAAEDLKSPVSFFKIPRALVTLGVNDRLEFYAIGSVDFLIDKVGEGSLKAKAGTQSGFELDGKFVFDPKLADASIAFWYKKGEWGASGTLNIPPKRVPGVKRATMSVSYALGKLVADGDADLDIPVFKKGTIHFEQSDKDGLLVGARFDLKDDLPIIKSGFLAGELRRSPEGEWGLSGKGEAVAEIAGHRLTLGGEYDRGIFDVHGRLPFKKGRIDGEILLGATNREYDKDGKPTGKAAPKLHAYGGGIVNVHFTKWLTGTIDLQVLPTGSWRVIGEVKVPSTVPITGPLLEKKIPIGKPIDIDIPLVNLGVASLYLSIGGGLEAFARIGGLELRNASFKIEYNPEKEDETHVTGFGILALPATVGITADVHVGVGGRILVITAEVDGHAAITAQLNLLAQLGAGIDWMPGKGIVFAGFAALTAEAEMIFRVYATVDVDLDLWLYTKNLYHHEFGGKTLSYKPPLKVGAMFPFSYREGESFDVDINKIQFTKPDFDAEKTMTNMFDHARKEDGQEIDNS